MIIRVAIVEDNVAFRTAVLATVAEAPDMQLCGIASDQTSGLALLQQAPADVLLVDLGLPDGSGLEVIRQARLHWPLCDVMVISVFGDKTNILAAISAGALGYLLKDMPTAQLADEIRTMHQGGSAISPTIARELLSHLGAAKAVTPELTVLQQPQTLPLPEAETLTNREYEILVMANKGFSYEEVAHYLGLSIHTVRTHVKRSYTKLQVKSKTQAIYELQRMGKNLA
jgi:DNA-binding NarL/FixJ family response regulator